MLPAGDDPPSFFGEIVATGAHRNSIRSVAAGDADACAVDCVTHALLADHAPEELRRTRILASSQTAPGMPYVTAAATSDEDIAKMRDGLLAALADPSLARAPRSPSPHRRERSDGGGVPKSFSELDCRENKSNSTL